MYYTLADIENTYKENFILKNKIRASRRKKTIYKNIQKKKKYHKDYQSKSTKISYTNKKKIMDMDEQLTLFNQEAS